MARAPDACYPSTDGSWDSEGAHTNPRYVGLGLCLLEMTRLEGTAFFHLASSQLGSLTESYTVERRQAMESQGC